MTILSLLECQIFASAPTVKFTSVSGHGPQLPVNFAPNFGRSPSRTLIPIADMD